MDAADPVVWDSHLDAVRPASDRGVGVRTWPTVTPCDTRSQRKGDHLRDHWRAARRQSRSQGPNRALKPVCGRSASRSRHWADAGGAIESEYSEQGAKVIELAATLHAVPFYLSVGYRKSTNVRSASSFGEPGLLYQPMKKLLSSGSVTAMSIVSRRSSTQTRRRLRSRYSNRVVLTWNDGQVSCSRRRC